MRKQVIACNIVSAIPAIIVVPLVPFIFILIQGEGRVPGYFHEYALRTLMVVYPLTLIACVFTSVKLLRKEKESIALIVSLIPFGVFALLFASYYFGGVVLR